MAQTWDLTLYVVPAAEGYGNNIGSGYGGGATGQFWDLTLSDGAAQGYGNNIGSGYGEAEAAGEVVWYDLDVTVLEEGATRPFLAPLDLVNVLAPLDIGYVLAPLDVGVVYAPLDVVHVLAPLDMETET